MGWAGDSSADGAGELGKCHGSDTLPEPRMGPLGGDLPPWSCAAFGPDGLVRARAPDLTRLGAHA
jgi:hypothetical protein